MIIFEWQEKSTGSYSDFTDHVNLADGNVSLTENAEEVTVGASTLVIDDPDGTFSIGGYSTIRVWETEAPDGNQLVWTGVATIRHIKRAPGFLTGPQRTWTCNLDDEDNVLWRRILSEADDADRPAESDVERIQWLFDEGFLGPIDTFFSTANPVDMDAASMVGMLVQDVVNDCMLQSGKNSFHQGQDQGDGTYLDFTFYDFANGTQLESDLQISNYISDITAEVGRPSPSGAAQTWYASLDTDHQRDPSRVYWKVRGQYDGGTVTRTRPETATEFVARETTASWPLVKTATKANARGDRFLEDISTEEDVITTTIWVHPEHVNDARAGWKVQARFSHLPGYEDWSWMRILNRTVTFETPEVYRIQYTLSPDAPHTPIASCATQVTTIGAGGWELGAQNNVFANAVPVEFSPLPTPTADAPSIVIGFFAGMNQTEPVWRGTQVASVTEFTEWGDSRDGSTGDAASIALAGYKHVDSGAAGIMGASWTGAGTSSGCQSWNALGCQFQTSATAPVQTGWVNGSGGTVTLPGTPTPGNLFVMCRFVENGAGWSPTPPSGWTFVVSGGMVANVNNGYMEISVRCVEPGDTTSVVIGDTAFSHWIFVSEWELT